ncbi:hypothetical protein ACJMK2_006799 [Sinanodonta woodiana]|uniref:Non-structural maintenance of chromosomes element 4 n=1 Tax=Sinanodonta woodiana TaxID=1069815 RepID=A0ABD3VUA6_SINWO
MEPDKQTPEERRRIREYYRNLIENIQNNQEDLINPESDALNERLQEAEELFKPVKTTREAVLDSQAMNLIANLGRKKAQALHTEFVKFQPVEFAEKLITSLGDPITSSQGTRISSAGWQKLGVSVQPFFSRSPAFHFMCGSFERGARPQKEPRQIKRKEKDNTVGKETVPRQLQSFGEEEKNEATTEEVDRVHRILLEQYAEYEERPLCYFEFVINPHSFGQTIENIFHVSFLVRDGHVSIYLDDDGLPVIEPVMEQEEGRSKENLKRKQTGVSLTPQEWAEIVKVFNIEEPTIPTRTSIYATEDPSKKRDKKA